MAANTAPIFILTPRVTGTQFLPADTTTKKTIWTAGANGSSLQSITISQNSGGTVTVDFYYTLAAVDYWLGSVSVTNNSGFTGVGPAESMNYLGAQLGSIQMASGDIIKAACDAALAAGSLTIVARGGDY